MWYPAYTKFALARQMLRAGRFRRIIAAESRLADFERELAQAKDIEECWARLRAGSLEFGFKGVQLAIDGTVFADVLAPDSERLWQLRIPMPEGGYVNFFREFDAFEPLIFSGFANSIERGIKRWFAGRHSETPRTLAAAQSHFAASAGAQGGGS